MNHSNRGDELHTLRRMCDRITVLNLKREKKKLKNKKLTQMHIYTYNNNSNSNSKNLIYSYIIVYEKSEPKTGRKNKKQKKKTRILLRIPLCTSYNSICLRTFSMQILQFLVCLVSVGKPGVSNREHKIKFAMHRTQLERQKKDIKNDRQRQR